MKIKLSLLALLTLSTTSLSAAQFESMGYKAVSMGGASVANSISSTASYNNPALLAKAKQDVEVSFSLSSSAYDHGAGAPYTYLEDNDYFDLLDNATDDITDLTEANREDLVSGKNVILDMDGNGAEVALQGYLGAQVYGYGFGIFLTSNVTFIAEIDQNYDQLIFENTGAPEGYSKILDNGELVNSNYTEYQQSSMDYALENGETYGRAFGIALVEVPIAYGHKFETNQGNVYVGGSLKFMQGVTYREDVSFEDTDEEINEDENEEETSSNFGIDLGFAYEPKYVKDLTLGLVAKNLNSPSFKVFTGNDIEIEPMVRMGVAYDILENLEVAMDIDLTSNKTYIYELESQMIGGGINYEPVSWIGLRAGLMTNLDSKSEAGLIYTAGFGFGVDALSLDLSGQYSAESTSVEGTSYPQYAKVELALITRW